MGTKRDQSGEKNPKLRQEWKQSGNKVGSKREQEPIPVPLFNSRPNSVPVLVLLLGSCPTFGFFPLCSHSCLTSGFLLPLCSHACPTFGFLFPLSSHSGFGFSLVPVAHLWVLFSHFVPILAPLLGSCSHFVPIPAGSASDFVPIPDPVLGACKWEHSGNKNGKNGNKVGTRRAKRGTNGNKIGTQREQEPQRQEWRQSGNKNPKEARTGAKREQSGNKTKLGQE